jgi:hypothetical protein
MRVTLSTHKQGGRGKRLSMEEEEEEEEEEEGGKE